jgi:hypothetical protein
MRERRGGAALPTMSGQVRVLDSGGVHRTPETGVPDGAGLAFFFPRMPSTTCHLLLYAVNRLPPAALRSGLSRAGMPFRHASRRLAAKLLHGAADLLLGFRVQSALHQREEATVLFQ